MRRSVIFLMLLAYLCSATELRELLKLPVLLEHFVEHKGRNSSLDFFDFLSVHYLNVEKHGNADAHDDALPFKTHENCHAISMQAAALPVQKIDLNYPETIIKKDFPVNKSSDYFAYSVLIWQPPKLL